MTEGPLRVLVAEDDHSVRLTLQFVLEDEGFDVIFAQDGQQALDLAQRELPDAILLDQMMPKMDGLQVYEALRGDDKTRRIPVFVLTGMARRGTDDWAGAHFIGKPFSPEELVVRIREVVAAA